MIAVGAAAALIALARVELADLPGRIVPRIGIDPHDIILGVDGAGACDDRGQPRGAPDGLRSGGAAALGAGLVLGTVFVTRTAAGASLTGRGASRTGSSPGRRSSERADAAAAPVRRPRQAVAPWAGTLTALARASPPSAGSALTGVSLGAAALASEPRPRQRPAAAATTAVGSATSGCRQDPRSIRGRRRPALRSARRMQPARKK